MNTNSTSPLRLEKNPAGRMSTLMMALGLVLSLFAAPLAASASVTGASPQQAASPSVITVPSGGTATITARGFCLDYGKPFPTGGTSAKGLADDKVRAALNYSIGKGYTDGNPAQVELAIWNIRDNIWHATEHAVGDEIVSNATTANAPAAVSGATALTDAMSQNKVTVTANFAAQTQGHYYGDGQIQIKNNGTTDLQVYLPVGTVFTAGAGNTLQDLAAYQLSSNSSQASTPGGTVTEQASSTTAAITSTTAPVDTATTAPVLTATTAPADTATTAPVDTATTAPVDTATTVPADTATTAPVETATTAPTVALSTDTPMPIATSTPIVGSLPATGAGSGGTGASTLMLLIAGMMLLAGGLGIKLAQKRSANINR